MMLKEKLDKIIRNHLHWLREDCDGWENMRANLAGADLTEANLTGSNLTEANLTRTNLAGADLTGANLTGAYLTGANIELELMNKFFPLVCPDYGSFVGWKKCRGGMIVKLEICENAKRSSAFSRKCRCSVAKVLEIQNNDGSKADTEFAVSSRDSSFIYKVGETVSISDFDEDRRNECSTGIHFFITRQEAVDYILYP